MNANRLPIIPCIDRSEYATHKCGSGAEVSLFARTTESGIKRVLRLPHSVVKDAHELKGYGLLETYFGDFLPDPHIVAVRTRDGLRLLLDCEYINGLSKEKPSVSHFIYEKIRLEREDPSKIAEFRKHVKEFIIACKRLFADRRIAIDCMGQGNVLPHNGRVYLLDFNGFMEVPDNYRKIIPLQHRSNYKNIPLYDMLIQFLYYLETRFLENNNVDDDPFYGTLKDIGRQEDLNNIFRRKNGGRL